jgi:hypothetical protein
MTRDKAKIEAALATYRSQASLRVKDRRSLRRIAADFDVHESTLSYRIRNLTTAQAASQTHRQALTPPEESILVDYIRRTAAIGHPASPTIIKQVANLIRNNRMLIETSPSSPLQPLGQNWVSKFKNRHPEVVKAWSISLDQSRYDGTRPELLRQWFIEYQAIMDKNRYLPENVYNMDETGISIGTSQRSQVLVIVDKQGDALASSETSGYKPYKVTHGRTEWVTSVETICSDGTMLPPFIIFKAMGPMRADWIPEGVDVTDWSWYTSTTGYTDDWLNGQYIEHHFEPLTRPSNLAERRLLVVDGYGGHVTSDFIYFCMAHAIDLMVLPAHSSHITQPLDVGVFRPLKLAMGQQADAAALFHPGPVDKASWAAQMCLARQKAMTVKHIQAGWRNAGLYPFNPGKVVHPLAPPVTPPPEGKPSRSPMATLSSQNRDFIRSKASILDTPTKSRILSLSSSLESVQAEKALGDRRIQELESAAVRKRKPRKGATVKHIGRHHFTDPASASAVLAVELGGTGKRAARAKQRVSQGSQRPTEEGAELREWIVANVDA